jgi:sialate O-acetylesterase
MKQILLLSMMAFWAAVQPINAAVQPIAAGPRPSNAFGPRPSNASALRLPALVSDGMVLQRDVRLPIWGWADPGEPVVVRFNGQSYNTVTAPDGKWMVHLAPTKAGGPFDMIIKGAHDKRTVRNILVGEVWIASGQSNMVLDFNSLRKVYAAEIAASANDSIREILVTRTYSPEPREDCKTTGWKAAGPKTLAPFSAAAYFFALDLFNRYHVPVGIINSCYGGTKAEAWTDETTLHVFPEFAADIALLKDSSATTRRIDSSKDRVADWHRQTREDDDSRALPDFDDHDWKTAFLPDLWDNFGYKHTSGVFWFRKQVRVPSGAQGQIVALALGPVDDEDEAFVNGQRVGGQTGKNVPRHYVLPEGLLHPGLNTVAIRVINYNEEGGFVPGVPMRLTWVSDSVVLNGPWKYQKTLTVGNVPAVYSPSGLPTSLFNAMIAPLIPYAIKGVIWYQGEYNTDHAYRYRSLFPAMIQDWRSLWGQGDFPFIYQQLPNFKASADHPTESAWAELREAQFLTLSKLPNLAMAVGIDIGEAENLHPVDKKDVGHRLYLAALTLAYGEKGIVSTGPLYQSMRVEGDKVILSFTGVGGGLVAKDGAPLSGFAIAGPDHRFVWADAVIRGNRIEVRSPNVPHPESVRYAWADNPAGCNLYNKEGLPASPFRTDFNQ